jgi:hypothetical protein
MPLPLNHQHRPGVGGLPHETLDALPVCRDVPVPRRSARRQPIIYQAPWASAPTQARPARLRRSGEQGAVPRGKVGIDEVYAGRTPEEKVAITRQETSRAPTLFIGGGINDAPALMTATVGLAFGHQSENTAEAAGAVTCRDDERADITDTSLNRVDELFHLARRMWRIALQSAVGGML